MSSDTASPAPAPTPLTFPVKYERFTGNALNAELRGEGTLTIRPEGPVYEFTGKPRRMFAGDPVTLTLGAHDIANVTLQGDCVSFKARRPGTKHDGKPFVFYAASETLAHEIASLLPHTLDTDFIETGEFHARLDAVAGPQPPTRSVTCALIALNVLAFLVMAGLFDAGWFTVSDLTPYIRYGANNGAATTDGEWWRLLTSMFLHYGVLHLAMNMWALFDAGRFLEKLLGRPAFLLTYLGSGLAGGFASIAWHGDQTWSAGASGAVFGVYGAILGYMLRERQRVPRGIFQPLTRSMLGFIGYNVLFGLAKSGIDNAAHFGGLVGGLALGWLLALPVDAEIRRTALPGRLQLGALAVAVLIAVGVAATPRFDYRVADELAFADANRTYLQREQALLESSEREFERAKKGGDTAAYAASLERDLVPFYRDWSAQLKQLQLAPDKQTGRRRDILAEVCRLRLESIDHLVAGLRAHDVQAFARYETDTAKVAAVIQQLARP